MIKIGFMGGLDMDTESKSNSELRAEGLAMKAERAAMKRECKRVHMARTAPGYAGIMDNTLSRHGIKVK